MRSVSSDSITYNTHMPHNSWCFLLGFYLFANATALLYIVLFMSGRSGDILLEIDKFRYTH